MLCLSWLVLWLVALVVLRSVWPWTMFLLSMLCSAFSSVGCVQGCVASPQSPLLFHRVCVLLSFCSLPVCPLELDTVDLAYMLLSAWLCGVSPSILDCCMSRCRVGVSPIVLLLVSVWWVRLLLWFLVVFRVRRVCSLVEFLCCSQVGSMFLPLFWVLLQTRLGVWLLGVHWGV